MAPGITQHVAQDSILSLGAKKTSLGEKRFVQDCVTSTYHFPQNYGVAITRNDDTISAAATKAKSGIMLVDENSLWNADLFSTLAKACSCLNGHAVHTFLSRAFESPFRNIKIWIKELKEQLSHKRKTLQQNVFLYDLPQLRKKIWHE